MTTSRSRSGASASPAASAFLAAVHQSVPSHSRRDLLRATAVLASAAAAKPLHAATAATGDARRSSQQLAAQEAQEITLPFTPFGQVVTLDPHRAPNWGPFWVLMPHVWAGLAAFDENGAVTLDLAESLEPNETADVWTATLLPELTFANGNPITAQSFVDSWQRALDPLQPAPMSTFMSSVDGYAAYLAGDSTEIGFTATDERTVEIRLSAPWSSFPSALATFGWAVIDLSVLDGADPGALALADAGAGIWRFTGFDDGERIVMEPNPSSVRAAAPGIGRITWRILDGPGSAEAALDGYRSGDYVSADVPHRLLEQVAGDPALSEDLITLDSHASTVAIGMDVRQEPFNDVRYRRAVAAAVDRERWAGEITGGEFVAATGLVPPVVRLTSGYEGAEPLPFDPDAAQVALEEAGFDPEQNMPDIVHYQPATDSGDDIEHRAALLAMIEEHSGLVIRHDTTLTADQISALQGDNGGRQFDLVWWWTVTDTPDLLRTIGESTSPLMTGWFNWSADVAEGEETTLADASSAFDELIQEANASTDADQRNAAYREAESLLIDNAIYVPLGHWVQRFVQKPWLVGTRQGPWSGRIPVRFDEQVTIEGRDDG